MTVANFAPSLAAVLRDEGGNDDDPADHGGRTSRGITQGEYTAWRHEKSLPTRDVWQADTGEVAQIYHDEYWEPLCDGLPTPIDYMLFDMSVNGGQHRGIVLLQKALGTTADGRLGPVSREAIRNADMVALITRYGNAKRAFYKSLHQPKFLRGWLNRVVDVERVALGMLKGISK